MHTPLCPPATPVRNAASICAGIGIGLMLHAFFQLTETIGGDALRSAIAQLAIGTILSTVAIAALVIEEIASTSSPENHQP